MIDDNHKPYATYLYSANIEAQLL